MTTWPAGKRAPKRAVLPLLLFGACVVWCWPRLQPLPDTAFVIPATLLPKTHVATPATSALQSAGLLPSAGRTAHAATLAQGSDGKLMAAWFAGSREGARDVAIYGASFADGVWSTPQRFTDRRQLEQDTGRLIRKLGNPVLWRDPRTNTLHLWLVSVSYGGWAGSAINHMQSSDNGQHWSAATRLITSPFLNISTLARNPPLALEAGAIGLPVYHEFLGKHAEWLRLDAGVRVMDKARIPSSAGTLQPAAVALDRHQALVMMRASGIQQRIYVARSNDAGVSWQKAAPSPLPNPDAAVALLRLQDGSLLLACNPLESDRNQLALLRSHDGGQRWSSPLVVEQGQRNDEFSYPTLFQDDAGTVHLAYTWKREAIRHVAFRGNDLDAHWSKP